jgi:hypothetical protein
LIVFLGTGANLADGSNVIRCKPYLIAFDGNEVVLDFQAQRWDLVRVVLVIVGVLYEFQQEMRRLGV